MIKKSFKITIMVLSILFLASIFLTGCEKKGRSGRESDQLFGQGMENIQLADFFSLHGWITLHLEMEPDSHTRTGATAGPMSFRMPYQGRYKKYGASIRAQISMDLNNMIMSGTSAPPPIIPEMEKVERYLVSEQEYFQQLDGAWYMTRHDPSHALLGMNYGIFPTDVLRIMELPDKVEALEDAEGYARYQLTLGERYYQAMEEEAKAIFKGEKWQAKQQELANLKALLPGLSFLVYVDKESEVIGKVEFRFGGDLSKLIGPQMPEVFQGMNFEMEGVFTFDFLKAFEIELPRAAKEAKPW